MWEIVRAGGPLMWPIILCSITAAAIILGSFMSWQPEDPPELLPELVRRGFEQVANGLRR